MIIQRIKDGITGDFFRPSGYFFLGWIIVYVSVGFAFSLRDQRRRGLGSVSIREALSFCFPLKTYGGCSAMLDYKILLFCHYSFFVAFGLFSLLDHSRVAAVISPYLRAGLSAMVKVPIPVSNGFWVDIIYTVAVVMARDLATTLQHMLFHKIPVLWKFHQVHHSASELNIFTILRVHPVDRVAHVVSGVLGVGLVMALFSSLLGYMPSLVLIANIGFLLVFSRTLSIFRHSHIWISFGPRLSRFLCSPAMHQIHHSIEERHHNKNFAHVFSLWDYLLGTLYIPKAQETLRYGIDSTIPENRKYDSFLETMIGPFLPDRALERWRKI